MRECPGTDELVRVAEALDWDVQEGLRHLQSCEACRARILTLEATRAALVPSEALPDATAARISLALRGAAGAEQVRSRVARRRAQALEALLAGVTTAIALVSSGVEVSGGAAPLLAFALGAGGAWAWHLVRDAQSRRSRAVG